MRLKNRLGILILTCIVVVSAGFWYIQKGIFQNEDIAIDPDLSNVVDEVSDKYQVQYTSIINGVKLPQLK